MTDLDCVLLIEGGEAESEEELISAWQHLINNGVVWKLQGFYGRTAERLIEDGICSVPGN